MVNEGYTRNGTNTLEEAIIRQSPTIDGWICSSCVNFEGDCKCGLHIFISCVGANMRGCVYFERGKKCRHCGLVT